MDENRVKTSDLEKKQARSINKKVHSLEEIIATWASAKAAQAGTTLEWVDIDYEKERTHRLKKGHKKYKDEDKFKATLGKPKYISSVTKEEEKRLVSQEQKKCENKSGVDESNEIFIGSRINKRHIFSLHCGLKLSASIKGGIGVIEAQAGIEIDVGLTKEVSKEIEEQGHISKKVIVKAQHEALFLMEVWAVPTESQFKLPIELQGKVPLLFKDKVTYDKGKLLKDKAAKHRLIFIPAIDIFKDILAQKQLPPELEVNVDADKVFCTLTGTYTVEEHRVSIVSEEQKPLATYIAQSGNAKKDDPKKDEKSVSNNALLAQQGIFKQEVVYQNRKIAVSMPRSLANTTFANDIREKIEKGRAANAELNLLIERLGDTKFAAIHDFLKEQVVELMKRIQTKPEDENFKQYLSFYINKIDKNDTRFKLKALFDNDNIDLFIREENQLSTEEDKNPNATEEKEEEKANLLNTKQVKK